MVMKVLAKNQIKSLIILCQQLKKKYSIKKENFLGHSDIAPLRKQTLVRNFLGKNLVFIRLVSGIKKLR